jgi:glycoside/pentoside/hexuronide:cation symporter, GPH family
MPKSGRQRLDAVLINPLSDQRTPPSGSMHLGYMLGAFGVGVTFNLVAGYSHYFITAQLGADIALTSLGMAIAQISIVAVDLTSGRIADRPWIVRGGFNLLMMAGATLAALAALSTFVFAAELPGSWRGTFAVLAFAAAIAGMSMYSVPHLARLPHLGHTSEEIATVVANRMMFMAIGGVLGSSLMPVVAGWFGGGVAGWRAMALLFLAIGIPAMLAGVRVGNQVVTADAKPAQASSLMASLRDRTVIGFVVFAACAFVGSNVYGTAAPFFVTQAIGRSEGEIGLLMGSQSIAALLVLKVWPLAVRRYGSLGALSGAVSVQAAGICLLALPSSLAPYSIVAAGALVGFGNAGSTVVLYSAIARVSKSYSARSGTNASGAVSSLWMASEKVSGAGGRAIAGAILGTSGWLTPYFATFGATVIAPMIVLAVTVFWYARQRRAIEQE